MTSSRKRSGRSRGHVASAHSFPTASPRLLFGLRFTSSATLSFMGNLGPAAAALMVLSRLGQHGEPKILLKEGFAWRIPNRGCFLGILIPVAILVLAIVALVTVSRVPFHWYGNAFGMWIESMIFGSLFRAWGEEIRLYSHFFLLHDERRLAKRRRALWERNPPRNSQLKTHRTDEAEGGPTRAASAYSSRNLSGDRFSFASENSRFDLQD